MSSLWTDTLKKREMKMKIRKRNEEKKTITSVSSIQRNSSMVHEQKSVDSKRNKNVKKKEEEKKDY